ncbi:MAG: hypothetical protein QOJ09_2521 [Actinomycetota bacterium]|nr:hypothetical protein [Actinomycetota bacterium]
MEFAVTTAALLVRSKDTVLRLPQQQILLVNMLDGILDLHIEDPRGAVLRWAVLEPMEWVGVLVGLAGSTT